MLTLVPIFIVCPALAFVAWLFRHRLRALICRVCPPGQSARSAGKKHSATGHTREDDDIVSASGEFMTNIAGASVNGVVLKSAVLAGAAGGGEGSAVAASADKNSFQLMQQQNPRRMSTMHSYVTDPVGDLADVDRDQEMVVSLLPYIIFQDYVCI